MLMPGEQTTMRLTLLDKMPIIVGQNFTVREHRTTVATGRITKVMESLFFDKKKMNKLVIPGICDTPVGKELKILEAKNTRK